MGYQVNDNIVILGDFNSDLFITNNNKLIETMMFLILSVNPQELQRIVILYLILLLLVILWIIYILMF
jgi:hypothetical protein